MMSLCCPTKSKLVDLKALQCPICFEFFNSHNRMCFMFCVEGHCFCGVCLPALGSCPLCRLPRLPVPIANRVVSDVTDELLQLEDSSQTSDSETQGELDDPPSASFQLEQLEDASQISDSETQGELDDPAAASFQLEQYFEEFCDERLEDDRVEALIAFMQERGAFGFHPENVIEVVQGLRRLENPVQPWKDSQGVWRLPARFAPRTSIHHTAAQTQAQAQGQILVLSGPVPSRPLDPATTEIAPSSRTSVALGREQRN
eukprot:RCo013711